MKEMTPADVVREHGPAVLRQLRRLFGVHADVDDSFQQVMLEIVRALPRFEGKSELSTWVYRITLNVAFQRMRHGYRHAHVVSLEAVPTPSAQDVDALEQAERAQAARLLYRCLEGLDAKKRLAVVLHDIEGLTLAQIAEQTGRPLQTVASQLRAGRTELSTLLHRAVQAPRATAPSRDGKLQ